jgi:hypothetical protein
MNDHFLFYRCFNQGYDLKNKILLLSSNAETAGFNKTIFKPEGFNETGG